MAFPKWVIALGILVVLPWGGCQLYSHHDRLSHVPTTMGVSNVLFQDMQSWGFGPGANDTGLIVYEMPQAVAENLDSGGLLYLGGLPRQEGSGWHGRYVNWQETPLIPNDNWPKKPDEERFWTSPGIGDYLGKYGYPIRIPTEIEALVNQAIFHKGSYFAYGRIGMIILIPSERRIVYAYNG